MKLSQRNYSKWSIGKIMSCEWTVFCFLGNSGTMRCGIGRWLFEADVTDEIYCRRIEKKR